VLLTANHSGGTPGYSYTWTSGPFTATYSISQGTSGSYIYTMTSADANSCTVINTISINFINNPAITVTSASICPGSTATLVAAGASTYTWFPGNFAGNSYTTNPAVASIYTVFGSANSCTSVANSTVTLKPAPNLTFNTFSITCGSLGSATVNAAGGIGPYSYTWTPTTQTNSIATGLIPGIYTITVLDNGTGCVYTPTTSFSPLVPLTGTVSSTFSLICNGFTTGTANISLAGGSGSQTYSWTTFLGTQNTPTINSLPAGVHTVNVVDALTFCSLTKTFSILQPPALTLTIPASSPSVCMGGSINFTANTTGGIPGYNYTWTVGPNTSTYLVSPPASGNYTYNVSSRDANNCLITNSISVSFIPNPTLSVSDVSICPLQNASLSITGANTYSWNNGQMVMFW